MANQCDGVNICTAGLVRTGIKTMQTGALRVKLNDWSARKLLARLGSFQTWRGSISGLSVIAPACTQSSGSRKIQPPLGSARLGPALLAVKLWVPLIGLSGEPGSGAPAAVR